MEDRHLSSSHRFKDPLLGASIALMIINGSSWKCEVYRSLGRRLGAEAFAIGNNIERKLDDLHALRFISVLQIKRRNVVAKVMSFHG